MNHEESKLQQQCVAWFRAQYPQYAMLLTHPINEGSKNTRVTGAIHKAEGTVAGVSDLLFFLPTWWNSYTFYSGLGIEFKTKTGRQSREQKEFQKMFEAAGYRYVIIRDVESFMKIMKKWIKGVSLGISSRVKLAHNEIIKAREEKEKEHFYKVIGKK